MICLSQVALFVKPKKNVFPQKIEFLGFIVTENIPKKLEKKTILEWPVPKEYPKRKKKNANFNIQFNENHFKIIIF